MRDDADYTDFVKARSPSLLRFAWMLTADAGKAEDLLQASLAKIWPRWHGIRRQDQPDVYVRRVMVNMAGSWRRRRWRFEVPSERLPEQAVGDETTMTDDRDMLLRALAALPPGQRAAVVVRYFEGLSESEAAVVLGCSVGTVKSQTARGLDKLRVLLPDVKETTQ